MIFRVLRTRQHQIVRCYSGPPLKRYTGFKNTPSLIWHTQIPAAAKLFGGVLAGAATFIHTHPNTLVTLGPPIAVALYFLHQRADHRQFQRLLSHVKPLNSSGWEDESSKIRVWNYDEADIRNVVRGIEDQYQHFQKQVLQLTENRIVDYVIERESLLNTSSLISSLMDENNQVMVHLGELPETFITSKADVVTPDGLESLAEFVNFSVPLYSSKNTKKRNRWGIAEVSLLAVPEVPEGLPYQDYRISIRLTPHNLKAKTENVSLPSGTGIGTLESFRIDRREE